MKINAIRLDGKITLEPVTGRLVRLADTVTVRYDLDDEGVFIVHIREGFLYDGRSGGPLVDYLAPNQGNQKESAMWLVHDALGYPETMSGEFDNDLLYAAMDCNKYGWLTRNAIDAAVRLTVGTWKADQWWQVQEPYIKNRGLVCCLWSDK